MGYFITTEPENAVPGKSLVSPKTHTPGSRVEERGHRFYHPDEGRWLSRDPSEEDGGANLYSFGQNASLGKADPLGLKAEIDLETMNDAAISALPEVQQLFGITRLPVVRTKLFYERIRESLRITRTRKSESTFSVYDNGTRVTTVMPSAPRPNATDQELRALWQLEYTRHYNRVKNFNPYNAVRLATRWANDMVSMRIGLAQTIQQAPVPQGRPISFYHSHPPTTASAADPSPGDMTALKDNRDINNMIPVVWPRTYYGFVSQPVLTSYRTLGTKRASAEIIRFTEAPNSGVGTGIYLVCW